MTKYIATFEFGSNINSEQAQEWLDAIRDNLPDGTKATLKAEPLLLDVEELTDAHAGEKIKVYVPGFGEVSGKLQAVFNSGAKTNESARTLVIDGRAWTVNYGVAQLSEW